MGGLEENEGERNPAGPREKGKTTVRELVRNVCGFGGALVTLWIIILGVNPLVNPDKWSHSSEGIGGIFVALAYFYTCGFVCFVGGMLSFYLAKHLTRNWPAE